MILSASLSGFLLGLCITLFVIVALFLILLILAQKGRGGGFAGAFGGAGGNTAFGAKIGDVLTWATSIVFGVFLLLAILLNVMTKSNDTKEGAKSEQSQSVPASNAPTK